MYYITHMRMSASAGTFVEILQGVYEVAAKSAADALKKVRKAGLVMHTVEYLKVSKQPPPVSELGDYVLEVLP